MFERQCVKCKEYLTDKVYEFPFKTISGLTVIGNLCKRCEIEERVFWNVFHFFEHRPLKKHIVLCCDSCEVSFRIRPHLTGYRLPNKKRTAMICDICKKGFAHSFSSVEEEGKIKEWVKENNGIPQN